MTATEIPRVIDIFRTLDRNNDCSIGKREFAKALRIIYPRASPANIEALFREVDKNGNGIIEYDELVRTMRRVPRQQAATEEQDEAE